MARQYPAGTGRTLKKEFYVYAVNFSSLAAAGVSTGQIPIQADSDFILEKLTYQSDIAGAAQTYNTRTVPLVTVLITDSGSNRQLMNLAIPIASFFGTGEVPFILPQPRVFVANSVIQIQATSFEAANTLNIRLAFIGHKVYRAG